jgi:hypothetical protein
VQQDTSSDNSGSIDEGSDKEVVAAADNNVNDEIDNVSNNEEDVVVEDTSSDSESEYFNSPSPQQPRIKKPSVKLTDYVTEQDVEFHNLAVFNASEDPITYNEAVKLDVWRKAMDAEIESIKENNTWELTTLPPGYKSIGVKWIYKTKYNERGDIDKHKARLVAKGYTQKHGIDFNEVFAPVARWETIRTVLALAAHNDWKVFQLDVKSAFLHGELTEDIYVAQPLGYDNGDKNQVYKLKKALYGLKQAPRAWYSKIEAYFLSEHF